MILSNKKRLVNWEVIGFNNTRYLSRSGLLWVLIQFLFGWTIVQDLNSLLWMRSWRTFIGDFFSSSDDLLINNIVNVCD